MSIKQINNYLFSFRLQLYTRPVNEQTDILIRRENNLAIIKCGRKSTYLLFQHFFPIDKYLYLQANDIFVIVFTFLNNHSGNWLRQLDINGILYAYKLVYWHSKKDLLQFWLTSGGLEYENWNAKKNFINLSVIIEKK